MNFYTKQEIAEMIEQRNNMIMVPDNFNHMIRLELKWAYVGFLNIMLDEPHFNDALESYIVENREKMSSMLGLLMNKKVDDEKLNKYINELIQEDLLEVQDNHYYLKK